jgi:hypothetical protein
MANPDITTLCAEIPTLPDNCISFPGGVTLCAQVGFDEGSPLMVTKSLFGAVNAALAPLAPIFNVLDVALALFKCVKAIPDALGPPPDPTAIARCIPDLTQKVNKLLQLIPQIALPATIKGIIIAIITFLRGLKTKLQSIISRLARLAASRLRAVELGNLQLHAALDCAQHLIDVQLVNMNAGMAPVNRLIGVVSAFMQIAGLGCIPAVGNIGPITADVLSPLDAAIEILQTIHDAIPEIPSLTLPSGGDC